MPRPRGNDWLEDEIKRLKQIGIQTVVSLLEKDEVQELGLRTEETACNANGLHFICSPIRDRDVPRDAVAVNQLVRELINRIGDGEKLVVHCRMGIGRAAIIAGAVLLQYGYTTPQLIDKISKARELKVPDTQEQINWLKSIERSS